MLKHLYKTTIYGLGTTSCVKSVTEKKGQVKFPNSSIFFFSEVDHRDSCDAVIVRLGD